MRCAVIDKDGNVINVIMADERESFPGCTLKETDSNIGDTYDKVKDEFTPPKREAPPAPEITANGTLPGDVRL